MESVPGQTFRMFCIQWPWENLHVKVPRQGGAVAFYLIIWEVQDEVRRLLVLHNYCSTATPLFQRCYSPSKTIHAHPPSTSRLWMKNWVLPCLILPSSGCPSTGRRFISVSLRESRFSVERSQNQKKVSQRQLGQEWTEGITINCILSLVGVIVFCCDFLCLEQLVGLNEYKKHVHQQKKEFHRKRKVAPSVIDVYQLWKYATKCY